MSAGRHAPLWKTYAALVFLLVLGLYGFGYHIGPLGGRGYLWPLVHELWPSLRTYPVVPYEQAIELIVSGTLAPIAGATILLRRFRLSILRSWRGGELRAFLLGLLLIWPLGMLGTGPLYHLTLPIPDFLIQARFAAEGLWVVLTPVTAAVTWAVWSFARHTPPENGSVEDTAA